METLGTDSSRLHATQYPWEHEKYTKTFDHSALRRGFQVYREVCAACHSLSRIPYRTLVGTIMTVDEAKVMAEENEYDSEPNDEGEIEKRPGKLSDYIPSPYKNDEAGRAANNGALPPDLSLIVKGRHGGCNYIFSLLTGYPEEPPAGAVVQAGLNFNPYFPGTGIAMARVLYDGLVEYEDGTSATSSQMAKDVTEFLNWAAEPEMDERKKMGWKVMAIGTTLFVMSVWLKRLVAHAGNGRHGCANFPADTSGPQSRPARSRTSSPQLLNPSSQAVFSGDRLPRWEPKGGGSGDQPDGHWHVQLFSSVLSHTLCNKITTNTYSKLSGAEAFLLWSDSVTNESACLANYPTATATPFHSSATMHYFVIITSPCKAPNHPSSSLLHSSHASPRRIRPITQGAPRRSRTCQSRLLSKHHFRKESEYYFALAVT